MKLKIVGALKSASGLALVLSVCATLIPVQFAFAGTWSPVVNQAPNGVNLMLLLSDGTVMAAQNNGSSIGSGWYRLTPASDGSYVNGTWTTLASMHDTRLYYSSQVLKDGRVFVAGGEYGTGGPKAEVYDPVTNVWTQVNPPTSLLNPSQNSPVTGSPQQFYDSNSEILPNGSVLISPVMPKVSGQPLIYDPATNTWAAGPNYYRGVYQDEASWVKLPDDSILTIDPFGTNSERYIPSTNVWVNDGNLPISLYDPFGFELGAAFLLPNGKAFFLGSTGHTALYTPTGTTSPGTWIAGPDIPDSHGTPDAPGAMMPTGKVLCAVSPIPTSGNHFPSPTTFYEYDSVSNSFISVGAPVGSSDNIPSYATAMLVLPDGNVLYSHFSSQLYVYQPAGAPLAAGKPVINSITSNGDGSYHLTGTGLNGISEGACYGDDLQMNSNYPLVRLTSGGGTVYYCRTYNWSSTSVMTGSQILTTEFRPPAGLPAGLYSLVVVANGIASDPVQYPPCGLASSVIYVKSGAGGANNGSTWTDAYSDLQSALAAATAGSQVWVAAGSYKPAGPGGSRSATFQLTDCVSMYGGFVGTETMLSQRTTNADGTMVNQSILSGDLNGNDGPNFANNGENSYHVVTASGTNLGAVLDGFTISGGNTSGAPDLNGGGLYINNGNPSIRNCVFSGNISSSNGGAGVMDNTSSPSFTNCVVTGNTALNGGGLYGTNNGTNSPHFTNCKLTGNSATGGGGNGNGGGLVLGTGSAAMTGCTIQGNSAANQGGGIYCVNNTASIGTSTFSANTSVNHGGGIYVGSANPSVSGCLFVANSSALGGAVRCTSSSTGSFVGCRFAGNSASNSGGANYNNSTSSPSFVNCLFVGNVAGGGSVSDNDNSSMPSFLDCTLSGNSAAVSRAAIQSDTGSSLTVRNSVLWNDTPAEIALFGGTISVSYTDVQGSYTGTGNINSNPLFIGGAAGTWTAVASYNSTTGQTTLTNGSGGFAPGALVGKFINPNNSQALQSFVVANTATTITVWGDFSTMGIGNGTAYQIYDYHISNSSPCLDTGNNALVPGTISTDLDGNTRIADGDVNMTATVDMGAYEVVPPIGPIPNPMFFAVAPTNMGTSSISMTATTAVTAVSPVTYMFECTSATPGGTSSFWQNSTGYTDTGLDANTLYSYKVAARDATLPTPNVTAFSAVSSAATLIESPTGISSGIVGFDTADLVAQGVFTNLTVGMSGLYFESMTPGPGGGVNTWVQTSSLTATGLTPDTDYEFRVKARNQNGVETAYSDPIVIHTYYMPGDCNNDLEFTVESDLDCIVDAMLGIETNPPGGAHRIDLNYDEITDGQDLQFIVDCLQYGGC